MEEVTINTPGTYTVRKHKPFKPERGKHVLYINRKSNIQSFVSRCKRNIENNCNRLVLYCMGRAIPRGALVALRLQEDCPAYEINCTTFTTSLVDEITDEVTEDYSLNYRLVSGLKIELKRRQIPKTVSN